MKPSRWLLLPLIVSWCILQPPHLLAEDYFSAGISASDLKERLDSDTPPLVVDLRTPVEFRIVHIPGALNIPLPELEDRLDELHTAGAGGVLIYCLTGSRTLQAEPILYAHDIEPYHLEGMLQAWLKQGYPIEKGGPEPAGWH